MFNATEDYDKKVEDISNQANEFGVQSLMHLEEQDEKLCYVEAAISNVDEEMVNVKKDIRQMKLFCGVFRSPTDFWTVVKEQPRVLLRTKREYALESDYLPRLLNDAKEEEMDSNLKSVDALLENLRDIAVDMNSELSLQETKMDKIKQLVTSNDIAMDSNSKLLNKLSNK
ncbi:unnamed protein product [Toxocara canis]|uniref:t-SNARE coiled-coil homology domain-containing protein n=1 Tax=Toxocara canis TaxID=6265 RepID=A0A183VB61_TOXCA|nr:unnamed protein product [Toxocara canis]